MKLSPAKIKKIIALSKKTRGSREGLSERQIAKRVKCSRSSVWYWLNK